MTMKDDFMFKPLKISLVDGKTLDGYMIASEGNFIKIEETNIGYKWINMNCVISIEES